MTLRVFLKFLLKIYQPTQFQVIWIFGSSFWTLILTWAPGAASSHIYIYIYKRSYPLTMLRCKIYICIYSWKHREGIWLTLNRLCPSCGGGPQNLRPSFLRSLASHIPDRKRHVGTSSRNFFLASFSLISLLFLLLISLMIVWGNHHEISLDSISMKSDG